MTRDEIIECIYNDDGYASCPDSGCEMESLEEQWSGVCYRCAEKQLAEYEQKIRAEAIDEFAEKSKDYCKEYSEWLGELDIDLIANELKEKKNGKRRNDG